MEEFNFIEERTSDNGKQKVLLIILAVPVNASEISPPTVPESAEEYLAYNTFRCYTTLLRYGYEFF